MYDSASADPRLPVPVSPYGPLRSLSVRVLDLVNTSRYVEALVVADESEWVARAWGDEKTVEAVILHRMVAHGHLGQYEKTAAVADDLLARYRTAGDVIGEAKVLAELARFSLPAGLVSEGMRYLARAGLLLELSTHRDGGRNSALASYALAATTAGLYEVASVTYEQLRQHNLRHGRVPGTYFEELYLELLLCWGLRLDQLGDTLEAGGVLRRADTIAADLLNRDGDASPRDVVRVVRAYRALALAKLGEADRAVAMAEPEVVALRGREMYWAAWTAHLAFGLALDARGDSVAARRELLAARQVCLPGWRDERLISQYELARLTVRRLGTETCGDLLETIREQARQLWQQRLHHVAMLRQARQREELEIERARMESALLHDVLTGLGNRRRFDEVMAAVDAGQHGPPLSLLVMDVDRFKAINDTYSHTTGDAVLRKLGGILAATCRSDDIAVRYAGDEFAVFLHADRSTALALAERIRAAVAATDFDALTPAMRITISIGVATIRPGMTAADLFHAADVNLYAAKRAGRDRVAA